MTDEDIKYELGGFPYCEADKLSLQRSTAASSPALYTPACGRSHILPLQQLLPFFDVMEHLPSAQQDILPAFSLDIMGHCLPSFPWQHLPLASLPLPQQSLPQVEA